MHVHVKLNSNESQSIHWARDVNVEGRGGKGYIIEIFSFP